MTIKHNTPIIVMGGQILPPPLTNINNNSASFGTPIHALLHKALASCGRVFLCLSLLLLPLAFASCDKEVVEQDYEDMLTRGMAPDSTGGDSTAAVGFTLTVDTAWAGTIHLTY